MSEQTITQQLKNPFPAHIIKWRVGHTNAKKLNVQPYQATEGAAMAYIDPRDVMKRFDDVCGDYWQVEYPFLGCCKIGLKINSEWIWRSNGSGNEKSSEEGVKAQYTAAFKRAAVLWGVGRYLHYVPTPWVNLKNGKIIQTPILPNFALPKVDKK